MAFKLFIVEKDVLVLNTEELRGIPEFRRILERDKRSKGDADGRKKFRAWKEFYYIYSFADIFSWINQGGYNEKEAHKAAIKESQLDEDFKVDEEIKEAVIKYKYIQEKALPSLSSVSNCVKALKLSDTICKSIADNIEATLELDSKRKKIKLDAGEPADYAADMATTNALISQLDSLTDIANKLPKTIETLSKLEDKLLKEQTGDNIARGGKTIANRADPK